MRDWWQLLALPRFRALWLALACNNLGNWCVIAALPVLVAQRFGAGSELVLSLGLRILPKLVLAPVSGEAMRRLGAVRVASLALAGEAALTFVLPWCRDFVLFQIVVAAIGVLDVFVVPSILSLRAPAMPEGLRMAGNTLCSVADRLAKLVGPMLGGTALLAGFVPAFLGFGIVILIAAGLAMRLAPPHVAETRLGRAACGAPAEFARMLRGDSVLLGLFIAAGAYMVMLGGLRPFLFWANRDWFGATDAAWTGLLAAQGAGALVGALLAGTGSRWMLRIMSAYTLTLVSGLLEGGLHLSLLLTTSATQAMAVLALASVPEIISTASWFTAMQQRADARGQGIFFSLAIPLWDCGYALGLLSAGWYVNGSLGLAGYWALVSLSATLPLLPLLIVSFWQRYAAGPLRE